MPAVRGSRGTDGPFDRVGVATHDDVLQKRQRSRIVDPAQSLNRRTTDFQIGVFERLGQKRKMGGVPCRQ